MQKTKGEEKQFWLTGAVLNVVIRVSEKYV